LLLEAKRTLSTCRKRIYEYTHEHREIYTLGINWRFASMKRSWPPLSKQIERTLAQAAEAAKPGASEAARQAAIGALFLLALRIASEGAKKSMFD
jgi:hypothetical protein